MTAATIHTLRRAGGRLLHTRGHSRWRQQVPALAAVLILSALAAHSIAGMNEQIPKPLAAVLLLAGAAIMLSIRAEHLLLGWLFLAPLLQESAGKTRVGHLLGLALYNAPPLIVALKVLLTRGSRPRREWFDFVPALYVGLVFASLVVTSGNAPETGTFSTLQGFYLTVGSGAIVYYIAAFWPGRALPVTRICWVVLAGSALQAVMVIVEGATGWNLWHDRTWWQESLDWRAVGTLTNPALTGAFIGVGFVIALAVLCWDGPPQLRRLALLMVVVALPAFYATKTRGPMVATLIASAACVLLSSRSRLIGVGAIAFAALSLILFWPQIQTSSVYQNRINQQQTVEIREVLQRVSFRLAAERPILGWGYNSFDRVKYNVPVYSSSVPVSDALKSTSHNTFLTIVVNYGGVGLMLFVIPFAPVLWRAWRRARIPSPRRWFYVAGLASVVVIEVNAATLDYRFFSFVPLLAWLFLGLLRREVASSGVSA